LRRKKRRLVIPRGSLQSGGVVEPPYADIARLDGGIHKLRHVIAVAVTLAAHAAIALAVLLEHRDNERPAPRAPHREIAAAIVRAPPPPPARPPPQARPPAHVSRAPAPQPSTPPPPAQAGRAVAVEGPADMTSFDLVVGQGKSYAGGTSSAKGTNQTAVHEQAQVGAPPRKVGRAPDLSRAPSPLRSDWACAWPDEAQDSELRDARVTLRVQVTREGDPARIDVIAAPPGGFAEAARRCAEGERYRTALDARGAAIDAATPLFNVHFLR